jgi:hypothetical protein
MSTSGEKQRVEGEWPQEWTITVCSQCGAQPGADHRCGHGAVSVIVVPKAKLEAVKVERDAALGEADKWKITSTDSEIAFSSAKGEQDG